MLSIVYVSKENLDYRLFYLEGNYKIEVIDDIRALRARDFIHPTLDIVIKIIKEKLLFPYISNYDYCLPAILKKHRPEKFILLVVRNYKDIIDFCKLSYITTNDGFAYVLCTQLNKQLSHIKDLISFCKENSIRLEIILSAAKISKKRIYNFVKEFGKCILNRQIRYSTCIIE